MKKLTFMMAAFIASIGSLFAQQQQMPPIPVDKEVRIGKLDNGLTYYIRHNNLPENQANFYIVQKVGSILEEDSQRGLAHFLEHMAFNGTKNFPNDETGIGILPYMESIGVKFGRDINAMTGFDETIYSIDNVPTSRESILDSTLMILHDWSNFLILRDKDITKERKVVNEEWRTRQDVNLRMLEQLLPNILGGTKYPERLPIGLMEVVNNFERKELVDYYHKWYRPDLQGIIIVGNIDVDKMEQKIKTMFADIKAPVNPAERVYESVPENEKPLIGIAKDKETPVTRVMMMIKRDAFPAQAKVGLDYMIYQFANDMIGNMLQARLGEMSQKENSPFAYSSVGTGTYLGITPQTDALQLVALANTGQVDATIKALVREAKRVKEFGFTAGEYERAKANYMSDLESLYNEREKLRNSYYVQEYINHFLKNEPIPSIEDKYTTLQQLSGYIPIEAINQMAKGMFTDKNRVIAIMGSENETYSSEEAIAQMINEIDAEKLEAYVDNTIDEPLIAEMPAKGSIVSEKNENGVTEWVLSNGAKVVVKPTTHKDDEILLSGYSQGGTSLVDDSNINEIKLLGQEIVAITGESPINAGGLGNFTATDLKKVLAGKNVNINFAIGEFDEKIYGSSTVKDLETAMQLLYLNFTGVRKDESAYAAYAKRSAGILANLGNYPMVAFSDSLASTIYNNNPRGRFITLQNIENANYDKVLEIYKQRFANPGDFVFTIVGNVKPEELKPLVEQYVASIPGNKYTEKFNANILKKQKGKVNNAFVREMGTPKASTAIVYTADLKYNLSNNIKLDALKQLLDMVLIEEIRERLGGTYGVQVSASLEKYPNEEATIQLMFDTEPERREELVKAIDEVVENMIKQGPAQENVQKVKEFMKKQHADDLKTNGYEISVLNNKYRYDADMVTDYLKYVDEISIDSVKKTASDFFKQGNRIEVSMSSK